MSIKNRYREKNRHKLWGMEVGLLLEDAERWWESIGKEKMRNRQFSEDMREQQAALDATNPLHLNYLGNSRILRGEDWENLSVKERYRVLKAYVLTLKETVDNVSAKN